MIELNNSNFDDFVSEGTTLVMMSASWCKRCLAGERMLNELQEMFPELKVARIDLQLNSKILMRYAPNGIPHFILFKSGQEQFRHTGIEKDIFINKLE